MLLAHFRAPAPRPVSVLIVDDLAVFREAVGAVIARHPALAVAGEATSGDKALAMLAGAVPDVIVLDHMMPGLTGLETAREIRAACPGQKIILFSSSLDATLRAEAEACGIAAALDKGELLRLPDVILSVARPGAGRPA